MQRNVAQAHLEPSESIQVAQKQNGEQFLYLHTPKVLTDSDQDAIKQLTAIPRSKASRFICLSFNNRIPIKTKTLYKLGKDIYYKHPSTEKDVYEKLFSTWSLTSRKLVFADSGKALPITAKVIFRKKPNGYEYTVINPDGSHRQACTDDYYKNSLKKANKRFQSTVPSLSAQQLTSTSSDALNQIIWRSHYTKEKFQYVHTPKIYAKDDPLFKPQVLPRSKAKGRINLSLDEKIPTDTKVVYAFQKKIFFQRADGHYQQLFRSNAMTRKRLVFADTGETVPLNIKITAHLCAKRYSYTASDAQGKIRKVITNLSFRQNNRLTKKRKKPVAASNSQNPRPYKRSKTTETAKKTQIAHQDAIDVDLSAPTLNLSPMINTDEVSLNLNWEEINFSNEQTFQANYNTLGLFASKEEPEPSSEQEDKLFQTWFKSL